MDAAAAYALKVAVECQELIQKHLENINGSIQAKPLIHNKINVHILSRIISMSTLLYQCMID